MSDENDGLSFDENTFPDYLRLNEHGETPELTDLFEQNIYPKDEDDNPPLDEDIPPVDLE
jgi:hypothetical protein